MFRWTLASWFVATVASAAEPVDFGRDIQPLLSDACFRCHGPDDKHREANLRLDTREGATAERDGVRAVVPGKPETSALLERVQSNDPDLRMPPPDIGPRLKPEQVALLRRWIAEGAVWGQHWAFTAPRRPPLPPAESRHPVDAFVRARLAREGLAPAAEASKTTLVRRVTLDLTGLPPTAAEVARFVADDGPDAYERLVDRLLASPRFGEHLAVMWLDAARYADTSGYQNDGPRVMWRWRDWVIDAFNAGMPFDQFTIEQLAGDRLPNATLSQRIATGFNRNHRGNAEGGIIPEEFAVEYVVDRVDTTATVWMALTLGCTRCHDHKYDPFTQRDFYGLYAYFNNVPEHGRAIKEGNSPPYLLAPTPAQQRELAALDAALEAREAEWRDHAATFDAAFEAWRKAAAKEGQNGRLDGRTDDWTVDRGLVGHWRFDGSLAAAVLAPAKPLPPSVPPAPATANQVTPADAVRFEPGQLGPSFGSSLVLEGQPVSLGDAGSFGYFDKFSVAAWVRPGAERSGTLLSRMVPESEADGYYVHLHDGRLQVNLVKRWLDDAIRIESTDRLTAGAWQHVIVTYDGSRQAAGIAVYVDGRRWPMRVVLDALNQTFATAEPFRVGGGHGPLVGAVDDVRLYARDLTADEAAALSVPRTIAELVARESLAPAELTKLRSAFAGRFAPEPLRACFADLVRRRDERRAFVEQLPTVMVMEERPTPRTTHLLVRGQYDRPGPPIERAVPAALPGLSATLTGQNDRLALARWLVAPEHPLTARVAANRLWELLFGVGLVKTTEDFGVQGERPSHPELLDWLATELVRSGWDVKRFLRLVATSDTYRQSSHVSRPLAERDPENRLLARGPRFRLDAERVRDQALALSGLLVERVGGPSVKPYQPDGLWKEIATDTVYEQGHGADLYRRSLYTYWKRTVTNPSLATFDASARESCTVRRPRTNTPLQALALMNDVAFVEAARAFAERLLRDGGTTAESRLRFGFVQATGRAPTDRELAVLVRNLSRQRQHFAANPGAAESLIRTGESPPDARLAPAELASYAAVASLILNLDEVVTRE